MDGLPIVSLTIFLPVVGIVWLLLLRGEEQAVAQNARHAALWTSLATFAVSLLIWVKFKPGTAEFQLVETVPWLPAFGIAYKVGVDGISMLFVILSTFLTPICVLASWQSMQSRVKEYMIAFLALEMLMVGMFCALDLVLFYVFFEGVLIPMYIIIGVWGGGRRVYAAYKFFLYTLAGSVLMMLAVVALYTVPSPHTMDIPTLLRTPIPAGMQSWLWLAFFASFAVKVPMWPVHTWLPDAHVEAPTAGSVILAGVLLKLGGYGFIRFSVPMLPVASVEFAPLIFALSAVAIIYTSLVALVQQDMKKLIAYSSIAHMGIVTIGLFSQTRQGIEGGIFQMLSHGVVSAALFLCVGVVYDRLHTREIARYGGLFKIMPRYAFVFMLMMLASVGLPGTSGFVGEFLTIVGVFQLNSTVALFAATGLFLGAAYMLTLYKKVLFGTQGSYEVSHMPDLSPREVAIFVPIALVVLWMGIYPSSFLDVMGASVQSMLGAHPRTAELGTILAGLLP